MKLKIKFPTEKKGGPGSGHHGHSGRPGQRGGSAPGSGGGGGSGNFTSIPPGWNMFADKLLRQRKTSPNRFVVALIGNEADGYNLKLSTRSEESGFSQLRGNKKGYNFGDLQEAVNVGNAWITDEKLPV